MLRPAYRPACAVVLVLMVFAVMPGLRRAVASEGTARPNPAATAIPLFQPVLAALKAGTTAPVLLPTTVPVNPSMGVILYARLSGVDNTFYDVELESTSTCNGNLGCQIGAVLSYPAVGPIDLTYFRTSQKVTLSNGITAIAGNPAYRLPSTIIWDQSGRRYSLVLPVSKFPQDLVNMANSMTAY